MKSSLKSINRVNSVKSVKSVQRVYSALLPPSLVVFFHIWSLWLCGSVVSLYWQHVHWFPAEQFPQNQRRRTCAPSWGQGTSDLENLSQCSIKSKHATTVTGKFTIIMHSDGEKTIMLVFFTRTFHSSHRFQKTFVFNLICSFKFIMVSITDFS